MPLFAAESVGPCRLLPAAGRLGGARRRSAALLAVSPGPAVSLPAGPMTLAGGQWEGDSTVCGSCRQSAARPSRRTIRTSLAPGPSHLHHPDLAHPRTLPPAPSGPRSPPDPPVCTIRTSLASGPSRPHHPDLAHPRADVSLGPVRQELRRYRSYFGPAAYPQKG